MKYWKVKRLMWLQTNKFYILNMKYQSADLFKMLATILINVIEIKICIDSL